MYVRRAHGKVLASVIFHKNSIKLRASGLERASLDEA